MPIVCNILCIDLIKTKSIITAGIPIKITTAKKYFAFIIPTHIAPISHNVPAVYDVLPARIRALQSKGQGWQNVAEFWRGNERSD
jgi:hypothetical protein